MNVYRERVRRQPCVQEQSCGGCEETESWGVVGLHQGLMLDCDQTRYLLMRDLTVYTRAFRDYSIGNLDHWLMTQGRKESSKSFVC